MRARERIRGLALVALVAVVACSDRGQPVDSAPPPPIAAPLVTVPASARVPSLPSAPPPNFETPGGVDMLCSQFSALSLPPSDQPSPAERRALAACDSEALYYGIGVRPDFEKARKCAYAELERRDRTSFGGADLLMMLYANGRGVPTNFDLALKFACTRSTSDAGRSSTVAALWKARAGAGLTQRFEVCAVDQTEDVVAHCAARDSRMAGVKREERRVKAVMGLRSRELAALENAAQAFIEARTRNEVDASGSTRAVARIAERDRLADEYVELLEKLADFKFSPARSEGSEARLATFHSQLLACKELSSASARNRGITRPGLVKAQRSWAKYRDAWLALVARARPRTQIAAWRSLLAEQRLQSLENLPVCQKK